MYLQWAAGNLGQTAESRNAYLEKHDINLILLASKAIGELYGISGADHSSELDQISDQTRKAHQNPLTFTWIPEKISRWHQKVIVDTLTGIRSDNGRPELFTLIIDWICSFWHKKGLRNHDGVSLEENPRRAAGQFMIMWSGSESGS